MDKKDNFTFMEIQEYDCFEVKSNDVSSKRNK